MRAVKFAPHALIIAVLASSLMILGSLAPETIVTWIIFQTWALYFLAGCTPKTAVKAVATYMLGALASVVLVKFVAFLTPILGDQAALPAAVLVVAFCIIMMEIVPPINFIPGYFVGSGTYFALLTIGGTKFSNRAALTTLLVCVVFGQVLGYVTVYLRGKYAAMIAPPA